MKMELPILRIIEMKPGLWIYSETTSHSSPLRCYFWAWSCSLGSPQISELSEKEYLGLPLSQGDPTWGPPGSVYSESEQLHTNGRYYDVGHQSRIQRQEENISMKTTY